MGEILKQRPDWNFYYISPPGTPKIDDRIHNLELDYGHNKFEARFNFPWKELESKIKPIIADIDMIYVNQSEQASNFRALEATLLPEKTIPIVSYFHYLPVEPSHFHFSVNGIGLDYDMLVNLEETRYPSSLRFGNTLDNKGLGLPIFMRQIEAIYVSDYNIICSNFGIDLLLGNAQKLISSTTGDFKAIPPPVSLNEVDSSLKDHGSKQGGKKRILFNHRLYNHYGPNEFFKAMTDFYNGVRQDFEIIVTNPTANRSKERDALDPTVDNNKKKILELPFVKVQHSIERDNYYKTVADAYLSIGPMKPSALWSMSVVDSMACYVPTLCPNYACFPELMGAESGLLFGSNEELVQKIQRLFDDRPFYEEKSKYVRQRAERYDVTYAAQKFINIFEKVVGTR